MVLFTCSGNTVAIFFIITNKSSPRLVLYKKASMMNNKIKNQQDTPWF